METQVDRPFRIDYGSEKQLKNCFVMNVDLL